jgi:poly(A) polymerase
MDWAKQVAFDQGEQHWITTGTVLTFGSYALGVSAIFQFVHYLL